MKHLFALGCLVLVVALACGNTKPPQSSTKAAPPKQAQAAATQPPPSTTQAESKPAKIEPTATQAPPPTATPLPPTPKPQEFNGSGKSVVKATLLPGLVVAEMSHEGQRNFSVMLLDSSGETVDLLANLIGPFKGSSAFQSKGSDYAFDIEADGAWSMKLSQPAPAPDAQKIPVDFSGKGQSVTPFFQSAGGLTTFTLNHTGERNFSILLLDQNGGLVDLIANTIGPFDGQKASGLEPGFYILQITADGDWSVKIE